MNKSWKIFFGRKISNQWGRSGWVSLLWIHVRNFRDCSDPRTGAKLLRQVFKELGKNVSVRYEESVGGTFAMLKGVWVIRTEDGPYRDLEFFVDRQTGVVYLTKELVLKHRHRADYLLNEFIDKAKSFRRLLLGRRTDEERRN